MNEEQPQAEAAPAPAPVTKPARQGGPRLTPKSAWRNKRNADFHTWCRQLDAYIRRVDPPKKTRPKHG